jgi:hypothetical protein
LFLLGVLITAGAFGLSRLASHAPRLGKAHVIDNRAGAGITVRNQVIHVWLPEPLLDVAKRESKTVVVQNHQELRKTLERKGYQSPWYAFTVRAHQVNGGVAELTFIRNPYHDPEDFQEFLDVLGTARGHPPRYPAADYSTATVHVMPAKMSQRELLEEIQASPLPPDAIPSRSDP